MDAEQRLGDRERPPERLSVGPVDWLTSPSWSLPQVLIANIWIGIPFNLVIMYSGLQSISTDVFEAAAIDGASGWQRFWRITFPLLRPVSAITLLPRLHLHPQGVRTSFWIMTRGGPATSSTTLAIWSYSSASVAASGFQLRAAVGNVLIIIAVIFASSTSASAADWRPYEAPQMVADSGCVLLDRRDAVPRLLDGHVSLTKTSSMRKSPPNLIQSTQRSMATRPSSTSNSLTSAPACRRDRHRRGNPHGRRARRVLAAKLRPLGGGGLSLLLLIAQMIPAIIMAMGFYTIYIKLAILGTVWGLILADSTIAVPFGVLIFTAFMVADPEELLQAARSTARARCAPSCRSSCRSAGTP